MKQFTFSAQVAKTNQLFSSMARLRLLLVIVTMLVLSIGQMYGYTITFNGNASESTSLSTSTTAASITSSSTYVTGNLVTATKVYGATSDGVKLGTSSNAGTIKFNLSTTGQVTPTSIVVNCKLYNSSKSATLKVNGSATQNVPSSSGNLTFAITSPITYIELVSSKYIWIKSVTVNTAAGSTTYKVTYDKNGATSGSVPTDNTSYTHGATVTVKSNSGNLAKTGYTFGGWNTNSSGTGTNYTAGSGTFKITANTTLYAKWNTATKYTVTFDAGSGTCDDESLTETSGGAGVTLPTANPPATCATNGWKFAGWWTGSVAETTTSPGELLAAGSNYKPTTNCTLYAVYSHTEAGGGGSGFYLSVTQDATTYYIGEKGSGSFLSAVTDVNSAATFNIESNQYLYYGNKTYVSSTANSTSLTIATTTPTVTWAITDEGETITFKSNGTGGRYLAFNYNNGSPRFSSYGSTYTYELTKHTTSTTTYNSNPDCGSTEPTYTLTLHSGLSCVIDGSATVELNATELTNFTAATREGFTCSGYWSAPSGGAKVLNADGTFAATSVQEYITDGKWTNEGNVTLTPRWECSNTMTLSVGTQSGGTYSLSKTSLETCDCTDAKRQVTITATPNSGYSVTDISYSGDGTATKVSGPTVNGNNTEWVYQFNQGDNGDGTFTVTFTTIPTYTITLDAGSGTCDDESLTETSGGAGVTLPTANPPAACATDGWEFAGWWTESVARTTTSPGELLTAGSNYKPTTNCTLYAVYSYTEAGGGDSNVAFDFSEIATANSWSNGTAYTTVTISPITINAIGGGNNGKYYTSNTSWRMYNGGSLQISTDIGKITSVSSNPSKTFTINDEGTATLSFSATTEFKSITVSYSSTTTTYNSNPVCVASWSITYDFAGGTGSHCSNTSVPQGNPYTICDEAPTKEGHTFQGWSDGINIHQPNNSFTPTSDITLTAQWQVNTYIVTWNNNGVTTPIEYDHGETLEVPTAPASCDGVKEFVGWTTHSGYYHATTAPDDIFTTKTTPVTAPATYYAVFATKGAGGTEFVLGESGTFKMYANVNGTNYYAQGGVSSSQITSTTNALSASEYTLTHTGSNKYTIQFGNAYIGHSGSTSTNLNTTETLWTITAGENGSWRITSPVNTSRALAYRASTYNIFKAYSMTNVEAGDTEYFDIEFGTGSSGYSDYTTTCQQVESIEVQSPQTEFYLTDDFTIGTGKVMATLSGGGTTDVTDRAHFSGYNMEATGTQTVTVTYMGATATYEITVKPLDNAWVLTWNVSGKTNTGLGPRSVTKGSAIGTLPIPEVPAACAGKTFMGWTESNIVPSDGKGIVYITEETVPSKNTTYYAVFATINNFSTQAAIEDIESGSKVVIVAVASMDASGGAGQAISSRTISITSRGVIGLSGDEVSIFDETINTPHSTCIWTLTKEGGGIVFEQGEKYIRAVDDGYRRLLLETTKDYWTLSPVDGKDKTYHMQSGNTSHYVEWFDHTDSQYAEGERYIGFIPYIVANDYGDFDMQFYVTANKDGDADITDYTTGCAEYTITYYGFHGGYSTSCSSDGTIVLPVNSIHTIPDCEGLVINDHTNLGREFLNVWMTQPHGGHTFKPGDTFILTQDTTLYAQWKMETTSDVTTLPTDIEDLAGTDIYVYGGTTLNIQPGTTTINSLTLKGGLQADGSYKMPTVWVPEGATLVRNSNKINLDLVVNAKTWYPFAVPFATKNNKYVEYLDPVLAAVSEHGTHFEIKTYDGARRADVGEDKANNWVRVLREETLQPGVGYIITALTYPDKDTATIRIPMTVPNTWFQNGEQAVVGTTVRNTIAVTAHAGDAATEHQRHAGWNFVANPYLTSFAGGNVDNDGGLAYINGELIIEGSYEYGGDPVPYVTIPAYDFAYYSQHKLSEVKLSPEWSFFVQVGTGGTMNFTTAGRQQAPASIAARNAEERPVKMDVDLILSDNHNSDQTGIIICDRYSDAYEIGRDLEKLFGSAYNLSVYTLMEDNTPLAFQALAIRSSMQVIPVGYRAPEQGEYTFRLNEATSSIDLLNEQYEQLVLVDYQTGELTNLLYTDYTFYSERTQSNSRFAIYAVPRQNAPTDLPNAIGSDEEVRKVIYNDHLYILRDGNVYNGMGQKM